MAWLKEITRHSNGTTKALKQMKSYTLARLTLSLLICLACLFPLANAATQSAELRAYKTLVKCFADLDQTTEALKPIALQYGVDFAPYAHLQTQMVAMKALLVTGGLRNAILHNPKLWKNLMKDLEGNHMKPGKLSAHYLIKEYGRCHNRLIKALDAYGKAVK